MTRSLNKVWVATLVCLVTLQDVSPRNSSQSADTHQSKPPQTKQDIDQLMVELSNWGRWGKDDRLGTMNLITAEKRRKAANLVKRDTRYHWLDPLRKNWQRTTRIHSVTK